MRIAMLGHKNIPSREGGIERVVDELSTRMVLLGHDVTVYNRRDANNNKRTTYKGVKIEQVFTINRRGVAAATSSLFGTFKILFSKNEVVHYHAEGPCYWAWIIKWFSKKKIVVTIHGLDWQRAKWSKNASRYIKKGEERAVKYADKIIVLTSSIKKYFKKEYGRDTIIIPNGVDKPEQKRANIITKKYGLEKNGYILYLGRLVPEKGIHYLIKAYKNLNTNKKLVIAGKSSDTDKYCNTLYDLSNDNDDIIFTGFVEGTELQELYSNAYIYCLPSDLEGMPLTLLEALSYGNCCVTSDIDELKDIIGHNEYAFTQSNVYDLAMKLQKLCDNSNLVSRYQKESQDYVLSRYSWDDTVEKTLQVYMES